MKHVSRPAISIIIPIYNQQQHLRQCVKSVLRQTLADLEVILVNDGSTDRTPAICRKLAAADSRVTVIDLPNGGVVAARREGFTHARGHYICFLDSDDWMPPHALQTLYDIAMQSGVDLVTGNFQRVYDSWPLLREGVIPYPHAGRRLTGEEFRKLTLRTRNEKQDLYTILLSTKLYKHECVAAVNDRWEDYPGKGMTFYEDNMFSLILSQHVNSVWITNDIVYYYRYGGMTSRYIARLVPDLIRFTDVRFEHLLHYDITYKQALFRFFSTWLQQAVLFRIHYQKEDKDDDWQKLATDIGRSKTVAWARENADCLDTDDEDTRDILNGNLAAMAVRKRVTEESLKMHYMKRRMLKWYMRAANSIYRIFH
ncbi:MAG: glycosyltransferase family 2 protein [Prevotella sp.]|nr:glycosyltransferase family 2 protein [Prevotella sp.]